jgi:carbon-monoxide dehydrogenase large subunit
VRKGDINQGFADADVVVEYTYKIPRVSHCFLEPNSCLVIPESNGGLTVYASEQQGVPSKYAISEAFHMDSSKVHLIVPYIGGGFGGKVGVPITPIVVLLALKAGKPVRITHTRSETFASGNPRSSAALTVKDGFKKDGTLIAREIIEFINGGAYSTHVTAMVNGGIWGATGSYKIPNLWIDCYGIYTNSPPTGPYRSLGSEIISFATERNFEYAAQKLGMDSAEIRMKNLLEDGDIDGTGMVTDNNSCKEAFAKAVDFIEWGKRRAPEGVWVFGKGVSAANKFTTLGDTCTQATCKVVDDGTIEVRTFHIELGQGAATVDAQVAAEAFGVPVDRVKMVYGDTAICPYDEGSYSSRGTYVNGNAIILACMDARRKLFALASKLMDVSADDLETKDGIVFEKGNPDNRREFWELFEYCGFARYGGELVGTDTWIPYLGDEDPETAQGDIVLYYSHGAWGIEVAVNVETGEIRVERAGGWYDGAQIINPAMAGGQIEGAFSMGLGQAIFEETLFNDKGKVINDNFRDYRIPTFMDGPAADRVTYGFVGNPLSHGPFGAKGIGEVALIPVLSAVANAVHDAIGAEVDELPLSRERVLAAIRKAKGEA